MMDRTIEVSFLQQGCDRGMWGAFHRSFYAVLSKQGSRASHAKGLEQRSRAEILCQVFTATIPWAFFPAWVSPCASFTPLSCSFLVFLIQPVSALPACSCHLVPTPAGKSQNLAELEVVWLLSPGFWMGINCKGMGKDCISLTLIFCYPC